MGGNNMLTMTQIENQITQFSFEEQLHLLAFIANKVNISSEKSSAKTKKRSPGGLTGKFWMAEDFDETPDCFKEYM